MVGRSSEVSLSRFNDIKMENVKDKNGCYNTTIQVDSTRRSSDLSTGYLKDHRLFETDAEPWNQFWNPQS